MFSASANHRQPTNTQKRQRGRFGDNGYNESFNGKLIDELLNGEIFDTLLKARVLIYRAGAGYKMKIDGVDRAVGVTQLK